LKSAGPRISAEIVFLKDRTLSPAVERFIACAQQVAGSFVRSPSDRNSANAPVVPAKRLVRRSSKSEGGSASRDP
jgi:hypothetical protein